jgi:hypothetical protein
VTANVDQASESNLAMTPRKARTIVFLGRALQIFAALAIVIAAVSLRVVSAGEAEIDASTAALRAGDATEATVHARRAAGFYAPGAPHVSVAYERLAALGTTAEGLGDRDTALLAWRAVRSAAIETRWIVTPHEDDLTRANEAIARLSASAARPPNARTLSSATVQREHLELLLRDESPRTAWVVALVFGFLAWTLGGAIVVRRAMTATGHFEWRRSLAGVLVTVSGIALWLLAIWRA